jgi:hypothetical protein
MHNHHTQNIIEVNGQINARATLPLYALQASARFIKTRLSTSATLLIKYEPEDPITILLRFREHFINTNSTLRSEMIANINNQRVLYNESASQYIARMRYLYDEADSIGFESAEREKMDVILRAIAKEHHYAPIVTPFMLRRQKEDCLPGGPDIDDLTFSEIESAINAYDINT